MLKLVRGGGGALEDPRSACFSVGRRAWGSHSRKDMSSRAGEDEVWGIPGSGGSFADLRGEWVLRMSSRV